MIPILGIPTYNQPRLLRRCLLSIDHPVGRVVIVDNGGPNPVTKDPAIADYRFPINGSLCISQHDNAGVAASWNEIIKLYPAAWWLLVNDDIEFAPGDLAKMDAFMTEYPRAACGYANHGASFWGVTASGIERVGLFDENIYPAYLEDCDWSYRADRLLGPHGRMNVPDCHATHGWPAMRGSCTVNATPQLQAAGSRGHSGNFNYYQRKWGGVNEHEVFRTPFNDPNWPLWAWKFEPETRARQRAHGI